MKACVILPTKNEEESISYMIDEIKKFNLPLIIVDEHSTDKSIEIAKSKNIEVYQREGTGKGAGVISAVNIAYKKEYDIMILIDCDATYPPKYIPQLLELMDENDMVIGMRQMNSIKFLHRLPNLIHTQAINLLFNSKLHDINSGLRAIRVKKFYALLNAQGFDIEAQITIKAIKHRLKIREIPIEYDKRLGSSKIRIKDGFVILARIFKERFVR